MQKEVTFYSRAAALTIMRAGAGQIQFIPLNLKTLGWGGNNWGQFTTSDPDTIAFLNNRREKQGDDVANRDVLDQKEWNVEFAIETQGARNVLDSAIKRNDAHNRLIEDLIAAGSVKLDDNGLPVMVEKPKKDAKQDAKKDDPPSDPGAGVTGIASTATKK